MTSERGAGNRRAQASVVGVALLVGLVMVVTGVVLLAGNAAIGDVSDTADTERVAGVMTELDSQASVVALDGAGPRSVALGGTLDAGEVRTDHRAGHITVSVTDLTDGTTTTPVDTDLGAVVYRRGATEVAYQGGGVWRKGRDGASMVSPPEFHYRGATLTLPIIRVQGGGGTDGNRVTIDHLATEVTHPSPSTPNPLNEQLVTVTVTSDYYEAWAAYFEDRTEGTASVDHGARQATVVLTAPLTRDSVRNALYSTAATGDLTIAGNGARTDSYDSDTGTFGLADGTVKTGGDVEVAGGAALKGDVHAGGSVILKGNSEIDGNVYHTDGFSQQGAATLTGSASADASVSPVDDIDPAIDNRVNALADTNDNAAAGLGNAIDADTTLTAGLYHVDRIELADETLTVDNTAGPVLIGVEEYVHLSGDAGIDVLDETGGTVRVYVRGTADVPGTGAAVVFEKSGGSGPDVTVPSYRSELFWIYGKRDLTVAMDGSSSDTQAFTGVVFAPAGDTGDGSVTISHAEVYGGVVSGSTTVSQGGAIHFDQALLDVEPIPESTSSVPVSYLHISINDIAIGSGSSPSTGTGTTTATTATSTTTATTSTTTVTGSPPEITVLGTTTYTDKGEKHLVVDWTASDTDDDLDTVRVVTTYEKQGAVTTETRTVSVSGSAATGSIDLNTGKHGSPSVLSVTATVTDATGTEGTDSY